MSKLNRDPKAKDAPRRRKGAKPTFKAVRPNVGIQMAYQRVLDNRIKEMHASVLYWIRAKFKANEPAILAMDELPATALKREMRKLGTRWQRNFDEAAPKLADFFSQAVGDRTDAALKKILRDGGFSVKFTMTRAQRDILGATVNQNVSLIKSIPEQYLKNVEGAVMRSVQAGRKLSELTNELEKNYGVTRRRAARIALSQNNMATAALNKARNVELGLFEHIWAHSGAPKVPRPTHKHMNGKKFDIRIGMYDPDPKVKAFIQPGVLPGCLCTSRAVIPGF